MNSPQTHQPLFQQLSLPQEPPVFSVSELSQLLKHHVEKNFKNIEIKGEISGYKRHSSGHLYFSLKDDNAVLDVICWKYLATKLPFEPQEGMEVVCKGNITTYKARSKYQMIIEQIAHSGEGALLKLLEERKQRLMHEGLFSQDRKKILPFLPNIIGIITSPTGAVIQDMLHRLKDRMPSHIYLCPVNVQGQTASGEIIKAIDRLNMLKTNKKTAPDVIIIARGGGSIEDLWPFNDEDLVRVVAKSDIPIISAIGHETDTTLIDYAADLRASTPSAAAELVVPVRRELLITLSTYENQIKRGFHTFVYTKFLEFKTITQCLPTPTQIYEQLQQYLDDFSEQLFSKITAHLNQCSNNFYLHATHLNKGPKKDFSTAQDQFKNFELHPKKAMQFFIETKLFCMQNYMRLLKNLSYERTLEKGFSLTYDDKKCIINASSPLEKGTILYTKFTDGIIKSKVIN